MDSAATLRHPLTVVSPLNVSRAGEVESVSAVFREVLAALPYYNDRAKAGELQKYSPQKLAASALADSDSVLIARIGQDLAGFVFNHEDDGMVWLSWFGVVAKYRGRGVGGALLSALDRRAKTAGCHKVWCDSRTNNEESKAILSRHGYVQLCCLHDHWYRQDFILWEKRVA